MRLFAKLLIGALAFALIAYAVYEPMPEYVQDREILTLGHVIMNLLNALGRVTEMLGLAEAEVVRRALFRLMIPPVENSSHVQFVYAQFADSRTLVATPLDVKGGGRGAGIIYLHGGGWVVGSPEMYWELYSELTRKTGVTVFAVRYRLAPEHKFPAAFDDCLAAVEAVFASAAAFGVDAQRIAIAGDSAGGQLAASVVQALRRRGSQFRPKLQLLVFPVTQVVNVRTESYLTQTKAPILKPEHMHGFISLYLTGSKLPVPWLGRHGHVTEEVKAAYARSTGQLLPTVDHGAADPTVSDSVAKTFASLATDYRASPLLGDDLEKLDLPPARILACEFDPVFDDAALYARRLEKAGVDTKLMVYRTYHGATTLPHDGRQIRKYLVHLAGNEL